jgi:hypothetical protein
MVHTDCLGFPGVDEVMAAIMPDWYCKMHLPEGRREKIPQTEGPAAPKGRKKRKNAKETDAAKPGSSKNLTEESDDGKGSGKGKRKSKQYV